MPSAFPQAPFPQNWSGLQSTAGHVHSSYTGHLACGGHWADSSLRARAIDRDHVHRGSRDPDVILQKAPGECCGSFLGPLGLLLQS